MTALARVPHWAKRLGALLITLIAMPFAALTGRKLQELMRGANYSDVGVPMYRNEEPAALLGVGVSIGLCLIVLCLLHRFLPACRGVVAWFGVPWSMLCNGLLIFAVWLGL